MKTTASRTRRPHRVNQPTPWRWRYLARPDMLRALDVVELILQKGEVKHPHGDGFQQPAGFHLERAVKHLWAWLDDDKSAPHHIAHVTARVVLAMAAMQKDKLTVKGAVLTMPRKTNVIVNQEAGMMGHASPNFNPTLISRPHTIAPTCGKTGFAPAL